MSQVLPRGFLTTRPFTRCQTPKILVHNVFFGCGGWNPLRNPFRLCVKIIVIVHHMRNSARMSFSSAHTKFPNQGRTNVFLTCTNEHYAANLRGVNAVLGTQSCLSDRNMGQKMTRKCLTQPRNWIFSTSFTDFLVSV
jgi:hypothetical protein